MKLIPFSPSPTNVEGRIEVKTDGFILSFEVTGDGSGTVQVNPKSAKPTQKNELWKETCFECFFGVAGSTGYFEFNGSTSGDWALYEFESYRAGMKEVKVTAAPVMQKFEKSETGIRCEWKIPYFTKAVLLQAGMAAVLKSGAGGSSTGNAITYWALKHAGDKPDFHLKESFIHRFV